MRNRLEGTTRLEIAKAVKIVQKMALVEQETKAGSIALTVKHTDTSRLNVASHVEIVTCRRRRTLHKFWKRSQHY